MNTFSGLPEELFTFYADLEQNNDRSWYADNRWRYQEYVLPPMNSLMDNLDDRWTPMMMYRPYRNVRFSPDKTPYKTHCGILGSDENDILHYLQVNSEGVLIARGYHLFSRDQLHRFYDAVDSDRCENLSSAAWECRAYGLNVGGMPKLTTSPRGFHREHLRVEWLRLAGINVSTNWEVSDLICTDSSLLEEVQRCWSDAGAICDWLVREVGPPEL